MGVKYEEKQIVENSKENENNKKKKSKIFNKKKAFKNILIVNSKVHNHKSNWRKFFDIFVDTFYEYVEITKVNGMFYLRKFVTTGWLRLFWTIILIIYMTFGVTLIFLLYNRYVQSPIRTVISPTKSLMEIPFPAVTICHPQTVMDYKVDKFVEKIKYPVGATKEKAKIILKYLGIFTEYQWVYPHMNDLEMVDEILDLNNLTVYDAVMTLGTTCEDFILVCYFAGTKFPCFQNHSQYSWITSTSHLGACCSFNFHPTNDGIDPIYTPFFSIDGGLSIVGTGRPQASDGKSGVLYSEGFVTMIHHPKDFAVEASSTALVALGKETFVDVNPTYTSADDKVLSLPFDQRNCINTNEKEFSDYRQPACMLNCLKKEIYRRCQCHPYHLSRNLEPGEEGINLRSCKINDTMCFVESYFEFKKVDCECFPSCSDISYKVSSMSLELDKHEFSVNELYSQIELTDMEFVVRVYFGTQTVKAYEKIVVMSWISLLSNLGGALSLCLGISLISVFEVFYYLTFGVLRNYKRIFRVGPPNPRTRY